MVGCVAALLPGFAEDGVDELLEQSVIALRGFPALRNLDP